MKYTNLRQRHCPHITHIMSPGITFLRPFSYDAVVARYSNPLPIRRTTSAAGCTAFYAIVAGCSQINLLDFRHVFVACHSINVYFGVVFDPLTTQK